VIFLVLWLGSCAAVGVACSLPFWIDRVIVWLMRTLCIFLFPEAIRLAVSLERDTGEWTFATYCIKHPKIGAVKYPDSISILNVEIGEMVWHPNWIERRIIYNACRAAERRHVNQHLHRTLPQ
jgi:hypothetical protein